MVRHLDLFSGIGGFALAVRWLGGQTVGFVETDPWCRRVLAKHWPGVPQATDVKEFRGDEFGPVDLVTGGFPCQSVSYAGQRRGAADDRWLWPEMLRVIATARPRYVLAENTSGLVTLGLDQVLSDLEREGYETGAAVFPACAVGAPHIRQRAWVLAYAAGERQPGPGEPEQPGDPAADGPWQATQPLDGGEGPPWPAQPGDGWVDDGLSADVDRRLKALGNAIVPQVAYELLRVMLGIDDARPAPR